MSKMKVFVYGLLAVMVALAITACPPEPDPGPPPPPPDITYTVTQDGGTDNTVDSTGIKFTFSASVDSLNLTATDFTVDGKASKSTTALSGTGTTRTLSITVSGAGMATVSITKTGIEEATKNVIVYKSGGAAPTVTGITATYNSTAVIYTNTPLNNLKAGLTVKAQYSNDSGEITLSQNDYTLSGTLTTGSSTVTVSYKDKTATFTVTVTAGAPTTPTFTVTPYARDTIDLSVYAVPNATGYRIYRSSSPSGTYEINRDFNNTTATGYFSFRYSSLTPDTTYYYKVSAYNNNGESPLSESKSATTYGSSYPALPGIPANLTATATSADSVTLSWTAVTGATGYVIIRRFSGLSGSYASEIATSTTTSYTDDGVYPGTGYQYEVYATVNTPDGGSIRGYSSTPLVSVTTSGSSGGELTPKFTVTALTRDAIRVEVNSIPNVTQYKIYSGLSLSGTYRQISTTTTNGNTFYFDDTSSSYTPSTTYYYKVSAVKDNVEGPQSDSKSATTKDSSFPAYPVVTGITATVVSSTSITISWDRVTDAVEYSISRGLDSVTSSVIGTSKTISYTDTGLTPGTTYYYKIAVTVNLSGTQLRSRLSNPVSATTPQ